METKSDLSSCICEGREFAHEEKVCQSSECYVCKDGKWEKDTEIPVL